MESLTISQPFLDGNKRVAFAAVDAFLRINGWRRYWPPMQIHALRSFAAGTFDIAQAPWLRGFASAGGE